MKIIFLDIDGVLNHEDFYRERFEKRYDDGAIEHPYSEIDPKTVQRLNKIIEETGANIVISSTWRHSGLEYCKKVLEYHGFKGNIIDITPMCRCGLCVRGNEINKWIHDNNDITGGHLKFKDYVILDDDNDMLFTQKDNFIQTNPFIGLTDYIMEQVINKLK